MPFVRAFLAAASGLLALVLGLGIVLQPLKGDLTRLGRLSERWGLECEHPRAGLARQCLAIGGGKWPVDQINAALQGIRRLSDDLAGQGLALTVMVVPDKFTATSAYMTEAAPLAPVDLWDGLDRAGVSSVNLRAVFAGELPASVDFYWPNDTHVGVVGDLSMGRAVIRHLHLSPSGKQS